MSTTIRKALRHATYPGDCTASVGQVMGPNTTRELMVVIEAEYDSTADTTRLGFAFATADEVAAARA